EICELVVLRSGDDHVTGGRVVKCRPRTHLTIRMTEERSIRRRYSEPDFLASMTCNRFLAFQEERDVDRVLAVEPLGEYARVRSRVFQPVQHPGAVRRGRQDVGEVGDGTVEIRLPFDMRLPVVRAEDDRVALEELVAATGRVEKRTDCRVGACERVVCGIGTER